MHANYADIIALTTKAPIWWDSNGVPRYAKFGPEKSPNIYAEEVVLLRVKCQHCDEEFEVEINGGMWHGTQVLAKLIKGTEIHYGDPPRHRCTGDSMNSVPVTVVEFWRRAVGGAGLRGWERDRGYEVPVVPGWAEMIG